MGSQSRNARGAGRPIQYDRTAAIEAATDLFYRKGFKDTSIQDVVGATGMQTGSVYAAFGSKLALFLECLDRDLEKFVERVDTYLNDSVDPISGLMDFVFKDNPDFFKPSFAAQALENFTDRDSEAWQKVSAAWQRRDASMRKTIERGQAAGQIRDDLTSHSIESHLSAVLLGGSFLKHYYCDSGQCADLPSADLVRDLLRPRNRN